MNSKRLAVLAAPLAASGTMLAGATAKAESPWSVKFGVSQPVDSNVRTAVGKSGFHFGVGYQLPSKGFLLGPKANSNIEFMYNQNSGHGNHLNYAALFYNEQINFGVGSAGHFYGGVGVGLARLDSKLTGPDGFGFEGAADLREGRFVPGSVSQGGGNSSGGGSQGGNSQGNPALQAGSQAVPNTVAKALAPPGTPVTTQSETKVDLAGKAILGYAWQNGFFTEATYMISGKTQGARVGGFALAIGMHF